MSDDPVRVGDALEGIMAKIEQVRAAQRRANRVPPDDLYVCPVCRDTGFEEIAGHARSIGTVRGCPRGCKPPRAKVWDAPPPRQRGSRETF